MRQIPERTFLGFLSRTPRATFHLLVPIENHHKKEAQWQQLNDKYVQVLTHRKHHPGWPAEGTKVWRLGL